MSLRQGFLLTQVNDSPEEWLLILRPGGQSGGSEEGVSQTRTTEHAVDGAAVVVALEHQLGVAEWFVHWNSFPCIRWVSKCLRYSLARDSLVFTDCGAQLCFAAISVCSTSST